METDPDLPALEKEEEQAMLLARLDESDPRRETSFSSWGIVGCNRACCALVGTFRSGFRTAASIDGYLFGSQCNGSVAGLLESSCFES